MHATPRPTRCAPLNGDFNWWLLIVGVVAGGAAHLARPGRRRSAARANRRGRSSPPRPRWIARTLADAGLDADDAPSASCARIAATWGSRRPTCSSTPETLRRSGSRGSRPSRRRPGGQPSPKPSPEPTPPRSRRRRAGARRRRRLEAPAPDDPGRLEAAGEDLLSPRRRRSARARRRTVASCGQVREPVDGTRPTSTGRRPSTSSRCASRSPSTSTQQPYSWPSASGSRSLATTTSSPVAGENSSVPMASAGAVGRRGERRPAARRAGRRRGASRGGLLEDRDLVERWASSACVVVALR